MATPVVMPKQGNSVESCLIMAWKKQVGDVVQQGDLLVEVETDKAIVQIDCPAAGTLLATFFEEGDDVPVMTNIAVIGDADDDIESFRPATPQQTQATPASQPALMTEQSPPTKQPASPATFNAGELFVSPRARMLADRYSINLRTIAPSGPDGRIIERDVQAAIAARPRMTPLARAQALQNGLTAPSNGSGIGGRVMATDLQASPQVTQPSDAAVDLAQTTTVPMRGIRKVIADRMRQSLQTTAQLTLNSSADARALQAYRKRLKASPEHLEVQRVSINDLLLYVVSRVLLDYPDLNATLEDETITQHGAVHLGFAMDTPRGLLVPVVRNAHQLSLRALARQTRRLIEAVNDNKIAPDELSGGTFTVSNLGALGIESFTPIVNPPQVAILGVGNINLKPMQVDEAVAFIPHMSLSLTIDHQAVDGAPGARFLQALQQALAEVDLWLAL